MKNKMSKCLIKLGSKKLKLGKLQDLIFNIDNGDKFEKSPSGYYCTNIQKLIYLGILTKNDKREYFITKLGKKNILKPYSKSKEFYKKQSQTWFDNYIKLRNSQPEKRIVNVTHCNEYYFNKWENLQNQLSKILINQ